jgi:hypothetical protein
MGWHRNASDDMASVAAGTPDAEDAFDAQPLSSRQRKVTTTAPDNRYACLTIVTCKE